MNQRLLIQHFYRRHVFIACILMVFNVSAWAAKTDINVQTICGWFQNPSPANVWLQDKNHEWLIGVQGGYQAQGNWPNFTDSQWVKTNNHYGYGCACMKAVVNQTTHTVLKIRSSRSQSLTVCKQDPKLPAID